MKHKMNKISGYYEGPGGVFYDVKHDEIFILEFDGCQVWRRDVGVVGRFYKWVSRGVKDSKIAVIGMDNVIRLGEL
jgi:hypothetical protein